MVDWRPQLPPLLAGVVILAAALWCGWLYRRLLTRLNRPQALRLLLLRLFVVLLLVVALFEPVWGVDRAEFAHRRLLALRDVSASMAVADDGRHTRAERAGALLEQMRQSLPKDVQLDVQEFDTEIRTNAVAPSGEPPGTDLAGCLATLSQRADIGGYQAVVLLTDGGDETVPSAAVPPVPLWVIGFGTSPTGWQDVAIADVQYPATVEKDARFEISVDVMARGLAGQLDAVPVALEQWRDGAWRLVTTQVVDLSRQRARTRFDAQCDQTGLQRYRLSIAPLAGELTVLNNARPVAVDVQKKSLHVLYFTRELGMEFKMLRNELGSDPAIAFTALFRTLGERFTVQGDRLAGDDDLEAGLPADEKLLQRYDCIIVGSFPARDWTAAQMQALTHYVEEGGAVIFLGGEKSFGRGGYSASPMSGLFPWTLTPNEPELAVGSFPVSVPATAAGHSMLAGVEPVILREAAVVESVNLPGALKPAAQALLQTTVGSRVVALVAVQPVGRGKVLAVASNTLWRWATRSEALRTAYGLLWRQAVRHLTGKSEGGRFLSVKWDRDQYRPGEAATVEVRVMGLNRAEGVRFSAQVAMNNQSRPLTVDAVAGQANTYTVKVQFVERGEYAFRLVAYQGVALLESYEKTLMVAPLLPEGSNIERNDEFLKLLAERSGGQYWGEEAGAEFIMKLARGEGQRTLRVETPLAQIRWAGVPVYLAVFLLALMLEWILRRRMNLI